MCNSSHRIYAYISLSRVHILISSILCVSLTKIYRKSSIRMSMPFKGAPLDSAYESCTPVKC